MFTAITVIHIIVSIILVLAVLLQVGKGASIGSTFGGASSQTLFGSAGPATILAKVTYVGIAIFMVTSLYLTYTSSRSKASSIMSDIPAVSAPEAKQGAPEQQAVPAAPAPAVPIEQTAPAAPAR
ncbi:MAG: preprotein translocase subunit SecG [Sedimentisphaerales bacterium]|nr:preprotein translocase subunit SecG [Sedimentisphaerales bacterium]